MDRVDLRCLLNEENQVVDADSPSAICSPRGSVGADFLATISDSSLRELYRMIITRVRETGAAMVFSLRCDTPEFKREAYVRISLRSEGARQLVEVLNGTLHETPYAQRVTLLDGAVVRGPEILVICSWCKQVKLPAGRWVDVEEAMHELQLFQQAVLPSLSHGMCPSCHRKVMEDFQRQIDEQAPRSNA